MNAAAGIPTRVLAIGDIVDYGFCIHCGVEIQKTWWGNGGWSWDHVGGEWYCRPATHAEPGGTPPGSDQ